MRKRSLIVSDGFLCNWQGHNYQERYLPERLVKSMTSSQYAYETRKKRAATKKGKQSASYSKKTTKRIRRYT